MAEFTPVEIGYSTSFEKWCGIRSAAEANNVPTANIDAMIARIEKQGDASLEELCQFTIRSYDDLFYAIFNNSDHRPCPHCYRHFCSDCPLNDETSECCKEWTEVKIQLIQLKYAHA